MGKILIVVVRADDVGVAKEEQSDGASSRAHIDRLPQPVEHKHWPVESRTHESLGTVTGSL